MTQEAFTHHRAAALALLNDRADDLTHKEGGFLGHVVIAHELSVRQRDWLVKLLSRHSLPPLAQEVANV